MGMGLGGRGILGCMDLANKGVHDEAAGNNGGICIRETNIQNLYRQRGDGGFQ